MKIPDTVEKSKQPNIQEASNATEATEIAKKTNQSVNKPPKPDLHNRFIAGCLAIGAIGLMITNPKKNSYIDYVSTKLPERAAKKCDNISEKLELTPLFFRIPAQDVCKGGILGTALPIRGLATLAANEPKNFLLFSIYADKVPFVGTFRTIGIGGQFITVLEK